jgi:S-adenosylmethionine decarboxylase proenzyme
LKTTGRHLLVEYHGCDTAILNDKTRIEAIMRRAAEAARATVVGTVFHTFSPQGVSGVVVVEESHLSIHTWPEYGYAAVDFYTCGDCLPDSAHECLLSDLAATGFEILEVERGHRPARPSIRPTRHEIDGESVPTPALEEPVLVNGR